MSCWARIYPAFANSVDPDQWKPTDLDLHCLSFSMWIYINILDQVIWQAENWKWAWHLYLFGMTRVNYSVMGLIHYLVIANFRKFQTPKFLIKWHMQTVQTQIRLLLKESLIRVYNVCHFIKHFKKHCINSKL